MRMSLSSRSSRIRREALPEMVLMPSQSSTLSASPMGSEASMSMGSQPER